MQREKSQSSVDAVPFGILLLLDSCTVTLCWVFPDSSVGKESTCNAGDPSSIPEWEDLLEEG